MIFYNQFDEVKTSRGDIHMFTENSLAFKKLIMQETKPSTEAIVILSFRQAMRFKLKDTVHCLQGTRRCHQFFSFSTVNGR